MTLDEPIYGSELSIRLQNVLTADGFATLRHFLNNVPNHERGMSPRARALRMPYVGRKSANELMDAVHKATREAIEYTRQISRPEYEAALVTIQLYEEQNIEDAFCV